MGGWYDIRCVSQGLKMSDEHRAEEVVSSRSQHSQWPVSYREDYRFEGGIMHRQGWHASDNSRCRLSTALRWMTTTRPRCCHVVTGVHSLDQDATSTTS